MYNNYDYMNMNPQQRLQAMEYARQQPVQQQYFNQQQAQPIPPQIQNMFVDSIEQAKNLQVQMNTIYIIVNKANKEVYIKQLNNDGNIDFQLYQEPKPLPVVNHEQNYNVIMQKIEMLSQEIKGIKNESNVNEYANATSELSSTQPIQTNGSGKKSRGASSNVNESL